MDVAWIAVDWGTTNVRAWAIGADHVVRDHAASDRGMAKLARDEFEPVLLDLIGGWLATEGRTLVIACGMVGARQGWIEVPYSEAPCPPASLRNARSPATRDPRLDVRILAGVMQRDPMPDVMRGEETQIAGILQQHPDFHGVICMPGTHTKWVRVNAGRIERFQTCMTGEMFALLSTHSVLRFSLGKEGWDAGEYEDAVRASCSKPEILGGSLFAIRAASLVADLAPSAARARLSGLLIGAELAATKPYWADAAVAIIDNGGQAGLYAQGLHLFGVASSLLPADDVTLAGLRVAHATLSGKKP